MARFLSAWSDEFAGHVLIVVEDSAERSFDIGTGAHHYCWADIDRELGSESWIIAKRGGNVRCFGFYKAFSMDVDMIVTLDDDCMPATSNFIDTHAERLQTPTTTHAWTSTGAGLEPRGFPYFTTDREMECVLNHGMWTGIPDLDAMTQLVAGRMGRTFTPTIQSIPRGVYFPMCSMNVAFKREMAPAMLFPLMGADWPFDRFGDIWAGVLVKRVCDHLGLGVRSGEPLVNHERASSVWANLEKESRGYETNERLWRVVDGIVLTESSVRACYAELARKLPLEGSYWNSLREAMTLWAGLFGD